MAGMEERYKKYIEKAKSVIKTLDPKHNPNSAPEINILRAQLTEKDKVIDELEKESDKAKVSVKEYSFQGGGAFGLKAPPPLLCRNGGLWFLWFLKVICFFLFDFSCSSFSK